MRDSSRASARAATTALAGYRDFGGRVAETKWALLELLIGLRRDGKRVVGYGAPGKGNTLLNYCGIRTDLLEYTVDRNPHKQGKFLPGTHIPIYRSGADRRDAARLHPDPAVEPRARDRRATRVRSGVGGAADRADPAPDAGDPVGRLKPGRGAFA